MMLIFRNQSFRFAKNWNDMIISPKSPNPAYVEPPVEVEVPAYNINVIRDGSGNVVTDISGSGTNLTITLGNIDVHETVTDIMISGSGNVVSSASFSEGVLTLIMGNAITEHQDISGKLDISVFNSTGEKTANKVTSISAQSTDAQYPSAKAVYDVVSGIDISRIDALEDRVDALEDVIGDINTVLEAL